MRTPETKRGQPRRFLRNSITLALDHRDPEKTTGPPTSDFHYGGSPPPRPQAVGRVYNTQISITAALDRGLRSTRTPLNSTSHYGSPWPSRPQEAKGVHRAQISITVALVALDRCVYPMCASSLSSSNSTSRTNSTTSSNLLKGSHTYRC